MQSKTTLEQAAHGHTAASAPALACNVSDSNNHELVFNTGTASMSTDPLIRAISTRRPNFSQSSFFVVCVALVLGPPSLLRRARRVGL